jgi:hypothetical protein
MIPPTHRLASSQGTMLVPWVLDAVRENCLPHKGRAVATVFFLVMLLGCGPQLPTKQTAKAPSEDSPQYAANISFSGLHLSAEENFLGQQLTYLDGEVKNAGQRTVTQLRVRLSFHDLYNEVVLREDHDVLSGSQPLAAGQTRAFQIRFDQVPASWNQAVPEIQVISVRVQ